MKKRNNKGFTLAELLIVVAIIAVLVAIAIPVFNSQLQKSQLATDTANVRSAYAEAVATALADGSMDDSGKITVSITDPSQYSKATVSGNIITVTHSKNSSMTNTIEIDSDVDLTIGSSGGTGGSIGGGGSGAGTGEGTGEGG